MNKFLNKSLNSLISNALARFLCLFLFLFYSSSFYSNCALGELLTDEFIDSKLNNLNLEKPWSNLEYNYLSLAKIPIKIRIETPIKNQKEVVEGQILNFRVIDDVVYNNQIIIKKNSPFKARIETIISNGMNGIPASIILGSFEVGNIESCLLSNDFEKRGLDLSLLVFPLKWALTPLPPTGSLTNFIKGGNVKIKKNDIITIFYYPNLKQEKLTSSNFFE